jgi:hypothetical protein
VAIKSPPPRVSVSCRPPFGGQVWVSRLGARERASFIRHESPDVTTKRDRHNPEPGRRERSLEHRFVVLPRHPLYGREVVVLSRRPQANITVTCIVALPESPAFRYRLPERWLESMPPSMPAPTELQAVRLPLVVLDTLT